jgi:Cu-processing system ATP-binding protein
MNAVQPAVSPILRLRAVGKRYGVHTVVDAISMVVAAGESLAIIGHNGAGKTTLMKLILGLSRPSSGFIELRAGAAGSAHAIGFLPEVVAFPALVTGRYMLRFYAKLKRQPRRQVDSLLEMVGLSEAADQRIETYSKGMRQRLGLAQALLGEPQLLLLDEPTSGMDPFLRRSFYNIIRECQQAGTAVIISSHALTEIEAQTDRIAILKQGRMIIQGSLSELRASADLPAQLDFELAQNADTQAMERLCSRYGGQSISHTRGRIDVSQQEKMNLLRALGQHTEIVDMAVNPPGLDALYTHFIAAGGQ